MQRATGRALRATSGSVLGDGAAAAAAAVAATATRHPAIMSRI
jgi:hypothetical protein